jgi:peptidoglycan/LPS O-acetylase OafA/YrhL
MNAKARLGELDALRGIAAAAVVIYHYTTFSFEGIKVPRLAWLDSAGLSWLYPFNIGEYGVSLFFVISGFVISMTLDRIERPTDFLVSRLSRLYPAFWAGIVVTTVFRLLVWKEDFSLSMFLANLTMFPTWFGESFTDGVYWTLMVEMQFYAFMLLIWYLKLIRHLEYVCLGWFALLAVSQKAYGLGISPEIVNWFTDALILKHIPLFGAGMMFFRIRADRWTPLRATVIALAYAATWLSGNTLKAIIVSLVFIAMGLLCAGRLLPLGRSRFLLWLGDRSYGIYLVHSMIGLMLMQQVAGSGGGVALMFLVPLAVSLVLAEGINRLVEKPSLSAIRRWYGARRPAALVTNPTAPPS